MNYFLIIVSVVILLSVLLSKLLYKFGVPSLLIFIVLGMLFGSDGFGGIYFDNYKTAEYVSSIALIFIMFYGGFGTKWKTARPVAVKAVLLSSLGTLITALLTGLFCMWILKVSFLYGLLFGSVIASTDAASVFSILRSRKLNLKNNLAPLLEIESGSNDPFAYMMTVIIITLMSSNSNSFLPMLVVRQLFFGIGIGLALAFGTVLLLRLIKREIEGFYPVLMISVVILGYALCEFVGGNGFLCVYIIGIIIGNSKILHKNSLVHFFDAFSWLMQIMLFFILGLLAFPSQLPSIFISGSLIAVFIIFISRPIAIFGILSWFRIPFRQQLLVSWVGFRGAASIVFAIIAMSSAQEAIPYDIFHIVLFVALFSIVVQGTMTPFVAKKLDLVDDSHTNSVLKTFNDYQEETHTQLFEFVVEEGNKLIGKMIVDSNIPEDVLIVMIKRNNEVIVPKGSSVIYQNDVLVLSGDNFDFFSNINT